MGRAAILGYRGCKVEAPGRETWIAANGSVTRTVASGSETRLDPRREFERLVLASAPPGLLPAGMGLASGAPGGPGMA